MNDRERLLRQVAANMDVPIVEQEELAGLDGCYSHAERTIFLKASLSPIEKTGVLAHEVFHALNGDNGPQSMITEFETDARAARFMLDPLTYEKASEKHNRYLGAVSRELGLPIWLKLTYHACLTMDRIGKTEYKRLLVRVLELIDERELTVSGIAETTGIDEGRLKSVLNGEAVFTVAELLCLAAVFKIRVDRLLSARRGGAWAA